MKLHSYFSPCTKLDSQMEQRYQHKIWNPTSDRGEKWEHSWNHWPKNRLPGQSPVMQALRLRDSKWDLVEIKSCVLKNIITWGSLWKDPFWLKSYFSIIEILTLVSPKVPFWGNVFPLHFSHNWPFSTALWKAKIKEIKKSRIVFFVLVHANVLYYLCLRTMEKVWTWVWILETAFPCVSHPSVFIFQITFWTCSGMNVYRRGFGGQEMEVEASIYTSKIRRIFVLWREIDIKSIMEKPQERVFHLCRLS